MSNHLSQPFQIVHQHDLAFASYPLDLNLTDKAWEEELPSVLPHTLLNQGHDALLRRVFERAYRPIADHDLEQAEGSETVRVMVFGGSETDGACCFCHMEAFKERFPDAKCAWAEMLQDYFDHFLPGKVKICRVAGRATNYDWALLNLPDFIKRCQEPHLVLMDYTINAKFSVNEWDTSGAQEILFRRLLGLSTHPVIVMMNQLHGTPFKLDRSLWPNKTTVLGVETFQTNAGDEALAKHYQLPYLDYARVMCRDPTNVTMRTTTCVKNWNTYPVAVHPPWCQLDHLHHRLARCGVL